MNNTTSLQSSVKHKSGLDVLTKYRGAVMGIAALWILFFHDRKEKHSQLLLPPSQKSISAVSYSRNYTCRYRKMDF